jgi:hypothetical protein
MSFEKGNKKDSKHYWLTPPEIFNELNREFNFDYDPCPFPKPEDYDGLRAEWGESSYVNPPFGPYIDKIDGKKKGPTAWAKKAIKEFKKGKRVVFVYPIDKWVLQMLEAGAKVRNLKDIHWYATEDYSKGPGTGRHVACFVLDPENFVRSKKKAYGNYLILNQKKNLNVNYLYRLVQAKVCKPKIINIYYQ